MKMSWVLFLAFFTVCLSAQAGVHSRTNIESLRRSHDYQWRRVGARLNQYETLARLEARAVQAGAQQAFPYAELALAEGKLLAQTQSLRRAIRRLGLWFVVGPQNYRAVRHLVGEVSKKELAIRAELLSEWQRQTGRAREGFFGIDSSDQARLDEILEKLRQSFNRTGTSLREASAK